MEKMSDSEDTLESSSQIQEQCKSFIKDQEEQWGSLLTKFSEDTCNHNVLELSVDKLDKYEADMNKSEGDIEHFEAWMNKPECVTKENLFISLQQYLKNYLKVDLESDYIKVLTSYIRGDENLSCWKSQILKKIRFISKYMEAKYIVYYIEQCFPSVPSDIFVNVIEKEHKSNLRLYFEMREKQCVSKEIYYKLITEEWNRLEKKMPVNYLFRYYTHLYGDITWASMICSD